MELISLTRLVVWTCYLQRSDRAKLHFLFTLLLLWSGLSSSSCFSLDPQRFESPHYKEGRFQNIVTDDGSSQKDMWDVIKWKWFTRKEAPLSTSYSINDLPPVSKLKREDLLAAPGQVRIVWLGHATNWIAGRHKGKRIHIITDPIFGDIRLGPERLVPFPIELAELPPIDVVLVSHAHRDHLDFFSLLWIEKHNPRVRIFMPDGTRAFAKEESLTRAEVIEWWQSVSIKNVLLRFTPAHHWSRMGLFDTMQSHWGSYVIELQGHCLYFGGDTGYSIHFENIARRYPQGFDAALLPIGAFRPRWFMKTMHIDPPEAIQAAQDMGARLLLPIHWGTFSLGDDLPLEAITYLKDLLNERQAKLKALFWHPGTVLKL